MTRREFVLASGAAALPAGAPPMGIATTSYMSFRRPRDTYEFLEYCHGLGAGGIQAPLASLEPAYIKGLRARAEERGMYIEVMCGLNEAFEKTLAAAKDAGALCVRAACLSGRRYETFQTMDAWTRFVNDSKAAIARAVPVAERLRIPLALENHKDWTAEEFERLLKEYDSPWFGVCLDFGNNISLLDRPDEITQVLARYAVSTHIKDMGLEPYEEGFLLSELPLGKGILPLKDMMSAVSRARPQTRFTLEMITRDPLRVPCLKRSYWATFPDRSGERVADAMELARASKPAAGLPRVNGLDRPAQLKLEDENVRACLAASRAF